MQHDNGASDLTLFLIPKTVETVSTGCDMQLDIIIDQKQADILNDYCTVGKYTR